MHRPSAACCFCCWVYSGWTNLFLKLYNADCLSILPSLADDSIDLILTDPPYGTTQCKWDSIIPFEPMWKDLKRVIKDNGCISLFSQQPFTTLLIHSNIEEYKYSLYWHKDKCSNFIHAKTQPRKVIEEVNIFTKAGTTHNSKNKHTYNSQLKKRKSRKPTTYTKKSKNLNEIRCDNTTLRSSSCFMPDKSYASNLIYFKTEHSDRLHPTQKPVALLEYLIKTYTNENDTVLDFTMGSGSTGVAAKNLNREFIGIELDKKYFEIASNRINENPNSVHTT